MGVVGHTQKNANSHVICKVKKQKMQKSRVICKVSRKKNMTLDLCAIVWALRDAQHVMSTNSHSVHFTSQMNKDAI